jgi:hypothetical protein
MKQLLLTLVDTQESMKKAQASAADQQNGNTLEKEYFEKLARSQEKIINLLDGGILDQLAQAFNEVRICVCVCVCVCVCTYMYIHVIEYIFIYIHTIIEYIGTLTIHTIPYNNRIHIDINTYYNIIHRCVCLWRKACKILTWR